MRSKIIEVKDEGTAWKSYLVVEFGVNNLYEDVLEVTSNEHEIQMMDGLGWDKRYGQYPYLIVDIGIAGRASAIISHFSYPEYDLEKKNMPMNSTNLLACTIISEYDFDDIPDVITEERIIELRKGYVKDKKAFWERHALRMKLKGINE